MEKATAGQRFAARFIDGMICYISMFVFTLLGESLGMVGMVLAIAYALLRDCLSIPAIGLNGQSFGKKAMKIKVVKNGEGIAGNYGAGVVRELAQIIPILNIVDAIMVLTGDGRRLGDKWADTEVVKA